MPLEVLLRFGRWDEILAAPDFAPDLPGARALRHAARAVALTARGEVRQAKEEQALFAQARTKVAPDASYGNNPVSAVLDVAGQMVEGEVLFRDGKGEQGLAALRKAVALEDALRYDEPPEWINPVRHALGAALSQSGRFAEAESVFREDLRRTPANGWSLYGLSRALESLKDDAEAMRLHQQFQAVWKEADVQLKSACFCQQGV